MLVFRKFADIGQTVSAQYRGGLLSISEWSDFVTVHALPGPGLISALRQVTSLLPERGSSGYFRTRSINSHPKANLVYIVAPLYCALVFNLPIL